MSSFREYLKGFTLPETWESTKQAQWWMAASAYGSNGDDGSPMWARKSHDDTVRIDPTAPPEYRPFWTMTRKGHTPIKVVYIMEGKERIEKGYRWLHAVRGGKYFERLVADLEYMAAMGTMPWGAGFGNEWCMEQKMPLDVFKRNLEQIKRPLLALRDEHDIMVSPPAFSNFININEGYGEAFGQVFGGEGNIYVRAHEYHTVKPPELVEHDAKARTLEICGMPADGLVLIEEFGWDFSRENEGPKEKVYGQVGADFLRQGLEMSVQTGMPIQPFLNFLDAHGYTSVSHPKWGKQRKDVLRAFIDERRKARA